MAGKFPFSHQLDAMDCGPACLRMISSFHGKPVPLKKLREMTYLSREGVSLLSISDAAEKLGFHTIAAQATFEELSTEAKLPCIVHWKQNHFVVVYKIKGDKVRVADPAHGLITYSKDEFIRNWATHREMNELQGILLQVEPGPDFYKDSFEEKVDRKGFGFLFKYLKGHRKLVTQLLLGLFAGSIIQLIFPFLTQTIVDVGINNQDISFITAILIAQICLFVARISVEFIRSWILLHLSTRINISIISDFLSKLMRLPVKYFDTKMTGDLLQRIGDHRRVEDFLTGTSLNMLFSFINLIVFGIVLAIYSWKILAVFVILTLVYLVWILIFMKRRAQLDHKSFQELSENQSNLIQLIQGMPEIKLNNCEKQKRWRWEYIQARIFKINLKSLALMQYQEGGAMFLNEIKNIIITFIAATAVVKGDLSLGMMVAVTYIIGQLNGPVTQLVTFAKSAQDAKISLERLGEVHDIDDEEKEGEVKTVDIPNDKDIRIENLSFRYEGPGSPLVLQDINFDIPAGKTTAIVGASGSGKTTLIKLLLKFYEPVEGKISLSNVDFRNLSEEAWRRSCGVVMQDGFIFTDTIAGNIAPADDIIDKDRLLVATKTAELESFVDNLPLSFNTKIGSDGMGMSGGQKQRVLIARVVYKNPDYIFFDEATSALDANNEKAIMENLADYLEGKTAVVVAHRLSTVKNADNIIVLDEGKIVERGTHEELVSIKGYYYKLVKNQLELGQ